MGFAGQVFAARVAVGLAMPSPKAFSQAGAMIGGFASKMYNSLNKKSINAAQKSLSNAKNNLATAQGNLAKHGKQQDKFLKDTAKNSVNNLNKAYGKLTTSAIKGAGAIKGLGKTIKSSKVKSKLFANVNQDRADAKDYVKMMENFTTMAKHERKAVMESFSARKLALENVIAEADVKTKAGKETKRVAEAEMTLLKLQEKEFNHFNTVRNNADEEYTFDKKKHLAEVEKAQAEVTDAQAELNKVEETGVEIQKKLVEGTSAFVVELKTNFIEALRESISVLTAFYYKLNENTQELIEFERELMNANSVFQVTRDELFDTGDTVVQFGQRFGLEMQNGATGLYQLASAGLSASQSMEVLTETLKLSMAVQGDHNTISKLVTQTLFGFEMEMNEAAIVADKFAYAIQKSLIEYQDLASAVKFALPFFTTTGQSLDQLLGALQILTNRALEAGIAGRGLRQGLAELAESIGDNTARFREFGIEVVDQQGNMLKLTEIAANFSAVLGAGVINDTELLTTLIEDLNVRGATAFVHLVQASDEFTEAVEATAGAGGQLDEMVRIQNESIQAQMVILKNNISMMFLYRDASYEGTQYLNAFHEALVKGVASLREILVVERDGAMVLTAFGLAIQKLAIEGIHQMEGILKNAIPLLDRFVQLGALGIEIFKVYLIPLKFVIAALDRMGPTLVKVVLAFHLMNKLLPITAALNYVVQLSLMKRMTVEQIDEALRVRQTITQQGYNAALLTTLFLRKTDLKQQLYSLTIGNLKLALENLLIITTARHSSAKKAMFPWIVAEERVRGMSIRTLIWQNILYSKQIAIDTYAIIVKKVKAWLIAKQYALEKLALSQDLTIEMVNLRKLAYEKESLFFVLRRHITDLARYALAKIQLALDVVIFNIKMALFLLTGWNFKIKKSELALGETSLVLKLHNLIVDRARLIQLQIYQTYQKIALVIGKKNIAATYRSIQARISSIFTRTVENGQLSWGITLRIKLLYNKFLDFLATLKSIAVRVIEIVSRIGLNVVMAYTIFMLYPIMIAQKIYSALVTTWENSANWLNFLSIVATNIVKIIYNIVTFIAAAATLAVTASVWLFTAAIFANPIGLLVVGVVLLIAGLVILAIRMKEQFDIWFMFKTFIGHVIAMFLWPFKIIGNLFKFIGEKVGNILEGPLFKLMMFIGHFFKMLIWYVKEVGTWFMEKLIRPIADGLGWVYRVFIKPYLVDPIIWLATAVHDVLDKMRNPLTVFWHFLRDKILTPIWTLFSAIWGVVKQVLGGIADIASSAIGTVGGLVGLQQGGYIQAAQNGAMGGGPYLVGEAGPELFVPQGPGKVIPNKDLNTQRVKNMLRDYEAPSAGADKAFQRLGAGNIVVETLEVKKANLKQSRVGVDTFGGYI